MKENKYTEDAACLHINSFCFLLLLSQEYYLTSYLKPSGLLIFCGYTWIFKIQVRLSSEFCGSQCISLHPLSFPILFLFPLDHFAQVSLQLIPQVILLPHPPRRIKHGLLACTDTPGCCCLCCYLNSHPTISLLSVEY